jgi:hypothetical protein
MPPRVPFSERHGHSAPEPVITVRQDAPAALRGPIADIAYECGLRPSQLRAILCRILREAPNSDNWSERPNIANEVTSLLGSCEWFEVYDFVEQLYEALPESVPFDDSDQRERFEREINRLFRRRGVGWQLAQGEIRVRGPEAFEQAVGLAHAALESSGRSTARNEIHNALQDLSRRPTPDHTGAVHHAMAALECVVRDVVGEDGTLGECLRRNPDLLPRPVDDALKKLWGFASERGRHLSEGGEPESQEVELIVGISAVVATYLARRIGGTRFHSPATLSPAE